MGNGESKIIKVSCTSPNQRVICFHNPSNETIKETQQDYDCVVHSIDSAAMRNLPGNEYKMYSYLRKNRDGIVLALSQKDACDYTGLSDKTYLKAVNALIDKGYLRQRSKPRNVYDFYLFPCSEDKREDDTPLSPVSYPQKVCIDTPETVVSYPPKAGMDTPEKGGEIIQDSILNNTENNIVNSIENNRDIGGYSSTESIFAREKDKIDRVAKVFGLSTEQAKRQINSSSSYPVDDDELPF